MKIVVGVDGSDHSKAALVFAAREAKAHDARLQAVAAWHVAPIVYGGPVAPPLPAIADALEESTTSALGESVEALGDAAEGIEIEQIVREGQAAQVLVEAARDADLLVVGTRGRGGFTGLLLGSTSQQCAQHAPCPTVIVPSPE